MATTVIRWSTFLLLLLVAPSVYCQSFSAIARWGQASAIIYDRLFVFGGKTDPEHQYTYTSAPNSNDLLSLDLSSSFSLSTPPWTYISGSQNTSTSQGPAVSFHSLTPYTASDLLLFGGDPGFSMIGTNADSAWLLNVGAAVAPSWSPKTAGWASEPIRRIYHAATSASGAIYILGGQKADGSQLGFPDPYLFNAVGDSGSPAFVPLPASPNTPAGLFGHAAHVLPGGMLLVFGGFSSSSDAPSPFSTIYTLNTASASSAWSTQNATGTIPTPRRGFASALLPNGKIIIHGGADAALQTLYSDGAVLDTTQTPMNWSPIEVLSGTLGPRVGHFAAAVQNQVLFGFGWAGNTAASADLALYDFASGTFQSTFTPLPAPISITTLPATPTAPGGSYPTSGGNIGPGGSGLGTPTHSVKGSSPSTPGNGHTGGTTSGQDTGPVTRHPTTGVVIGSVLGFLALVGLAGSGVYYTLRQRERHALMTDNNIKGGQWTLMAEGDQWDTTMYESPTQPGMNVQMAGTGWYGQPRRRWALLSLGGLISTGGTLGKRRRLDMLADEDAQQFDIDYAFQDGEGYASSYRNFKPRQGKRRRGTGGSSVSVDSLWNGIWNTSVTSLRNVGTALGMTATATATGAAAAREGRGRDVNPAEWWEKEDLPLDPFRDPVDDMTGAESTAAVRTDASPDDGGHATSKYMNPFADKGEVEGNVADAKDDVSASLLGDYHDEGVVSALGSEQPESSRSSLSRSFAATGIARVGASSPGPSEHAGSTSAESHDAPSRNSQASSNRGTGVSSSSTDHSSSTKAPSSPRTKTIIGLTSAPSAPMRRSDSWWSRFSRTPFLDRHDVSHQRPTGVGGLAEFRDPNPPPRLGPIQESRHSSQEPSLDASSAVVTGDATKGKPQKKGSGYAASTRSSIKTVDSELIEHMDGRMEVVQRALSHTSRVTASPTTTIDSLELQDEVHKWRLPPLKPTSFDPEEQWLVTAVGESEPALAESPTEPAVSPTLALDALASTSSSSHVPTRLRASTSGSSRRTEFRPPRRALTGNVAARVSAYERRMSEDASNPQSPLAHGNFRPKDNEADRGRRGSVGYGLVPKAPLFVANPDHRKPSEDSN